MTTWASFLNGVRLYLNDTRDTPKYSDKLIYLYTCDALRDYSNWFPLITRTEIDCVGGVYAVPSDLMDIRAVEIPAATYLKTRMARPGFKFRTLSHPSLYWKIGSFIYLNSDTTDSIFLTYGACHTLPTSETDTTFEFTVPEGDMELLNLYARAKCLGQTRSRQANLDRFKRRGERDDNPLINETQTLMDEYYSKIAERSKGGVVYLYGV